MLVRQFDQLNDELRPWMPCRTWCKKFSDRWATALVNPSARYLYYRRGGRFGGGPLGGEGGTVGGLVLAPTAELFCACACGVRLLACACGACMRHVCGCLSALVHACAQPVPTREACVRVHVLNAG